jgi:hypothetical protein
LCLSVLWNLSNTPLKNSWRCLNADRAIEPRLNQIFLPLLSIIEDPKDREEMKELARRYHGEMIAERGMDLEAHVLESDPGEESGPAARGEGHRELAARPAWGGIRAEDNLEVGAKRAPQETAVSYEPFKEWLHSSAGRTFQAAETLTSGMEFRYRPID